MVGHAGQIQNRARAERGPVPKQDKESAPKHDQESLSSRSVDCVCKAGASSWSWSINQNRTGNLSLLLPWTVSARQVSLPGQLVSSFTGPFSYSCFSVRSYFPVLLGPYVTCDRWHVTGDMWHGTQLKLLQQKVWEAVSGVELVQWAFRQTGDSLVL